MCTKYWLSALDMHAQELCNLSKLSVSMGFCSFFGECKAFKLTNK